MTSFADKELAKTDRNGKLGTLLDDVANIATKSGGPMRGAMQSVMGIDKRAHLPNFADVPLTKKAAHSVPAPNPDGPGFRSEEHTSELQSLMRISYAVFCLKKKNKPQPHHKTAHAQLR